MTIAMNESPVLERLDGYYPLDSLPSTIRFCNSRDIHSNDDIVLQAIINDNVKELDRLSNESNLIDWSLTVKISCSIDDDADEDNMGHFSKFSGTFNALHVAIILDSTNVFCYLLKSMPEEMIKKPVSVTNTQKYVDVNDRWIFQANCAHLAVKYMPTALQLLLTNNQSADLKGIPSEGFGTYPLHLAVMNKDALCIRILLRQKVYLDVQDEAGYTPLHYASRTNNLSCLSELLEAGANPSITSIHGKTPLSNATSYECAQLLLNFMSEEKENESEKNLIRDTLVQNVRKNQFLEATEAILDSAVTSRGDL